ncbi:cell envelope integrity protein TolA [Massilia sp. Dwa41.01b]|nr:cell envelope integrity protein TolA [Massilia sp. Dwa41.01b]QNB01400.1 cell envelope integrity protein TolA [Massilia sp. Se16.2.3]
MKPATPGAPYTVPPEPNRMPAILLAVGVHAVLLAFLWFGISWQNKEPIAVEAEVWDMKVETAAAPPLPTPPQPEPEPEPAPQPKPVPPPPKAVEPEPVKPSQAEIKLEREKKLAELKKQREIDQKERDIARQKEIAEQKKRDAADKKDAERKIAEKKEADKKADEDKKKTAAAEKAAKLKADKADQAKLDKMRADDLKRMMGAIGSTGSAEKSSGPKGDPSYQAAIAAKVKSNTNFTGSTDVPGNPKAVFKVDQLPTGEILSVRLTKSSGIPQFDDAVERGINKSSPLPKRKDGTVERTVVVGFSMKDLE